ncbi:hypothetical protein GF373_00870, partial [bacterium]|nr:hypothetical protein [bacterium]
MSLLFNLLWIVLGGGIFIFFGYLFVGILLCLTIIGIPPGVQCFKLSILALTPFGKRLEIGQAGFGPVSAGMNILWLILGGLILACLHLLFAIVLALSIIGIPFAI